MRAEIAAPSRMSCCLLSAVPVRSETYAEIVAWSAMRASALRHGLALGKANEHSTQVIAVHHVLDRAAGDRRAGHAEHHTRLLALGDRLAARVLDREHALGAVTAHAGEHDAHRTAPV